jgi:group II intron reverse transcriptase/maturase
MLDIVGPDTHKPTSLWGISNKAKLNKRHRFQNLYRCLNEELLLNCWPSLNKDASSGVDGVTWQMYAQDLHANVKALVARLKAKQYRAKLVLRRYIPKGDDKLRPLGIPVIEDKLVQSGCARILIAIYEQDFLPVSYGYRPNRSAQDAVRDLTFDLQFGCYGHVVEADIQGFFDHMDHDWLLTMLQERIDDRAFLALIRKWLKAGILETDGQVVHPDTGCPQGGVISPVLANVYLHFALDLWFEKVVKQHCRGDALISRYADDWVCAFRYLEDANRFFKVLPKRLRKFKLEIAPTKTRLIRFSRFHPSMRRGFQYLGFQFNWHLDRQGIPRVQRRTLAKKLRAACRKIKLWIKFNRHLSREDFITGLNRRLQGHYNYYGVRGNHRRIDRFYWWAVQCMYKWLNRRGGKQVSYTWEKFLSLIPVWGIAKPCITEVRRRRVFA